jgi:hypothetical protein
MVGGVLSAAIVVFAAADAAASTTLGNTPMPNSGCTADDTYIQEGTNPSVPSYTAPFAGVITAWSFQAASPAPTTLKLKTARDTGGGNWMIVGGSARQNPPASTLSTYPTRIAVQAGDVIGYYISDAVFCSFGTGDPTDTADTYGITGGDPPPGTTPTYTVTHTVRIDISAQLERDADGDGFGDETQDQCFTDPSTQGPCPAPTIAGTAQIGLTLTGTPGGSPVGPSYRWLDCDTGGASCTAIAGATGNSYVVATSDAGHTLRFRKTATDASGTQTNDSAQTAVVPAPLPPVGPLPGPGPLSRPSCGFGPMRASGNSSDGSILVTARVPRAGRLDFLGTEDIPRAWTARRHPGRDRFAYGRLGRRVRSGARVRIRLSPNRKGRLLLQRHRRFGWALHIRAWAIYTPRGGPTCAQARKVRVLEGR